MHEVVLREFVPGIGVGPGDIPFLCPGCWAADKRLAVPEGMDLLTWFMAGIWILEIAGYAADDMDAAKLAKAYEEEPWHDS